MDCKVSLLNLSILDLIPRQTVSQTYPVRIPFLFVGLVNRQTRVLGLSVYFFTFKKRDFYWICGSSLKERRKGFYKSHFKRTKTKT